MHTLKLENLSVKQITAPHAELSTALTTLTAKQARELIDQEGKHLAPNRAMSGATIEAYRRDMIGGRWDGANGEALKFNPEGLLIDGEHRVRALSRIQDEEYAVTFLVFFGVPDTARDTMDDGRKRSAADKFNLSHGAGKLGIKLSSALRALAIIGSGQGSGGRMSSSALIQLNAEHPKLLDVVKKVMDVDKEDQVPVRPAVIVAVYYAAKFLLKDKRADNFLSVMRSGDKDYDKDPVHAWREYVIRSAAAGKRLSEAELIRGTLKAWNMFAKSEELAGRWSIPKEQPLLDGLTVPKVFGDMVEGFLVSGPKETAPIPSTQPPQTQATTKGQKVKEDSTPPTKGRRSSSGASKDKPEAEGSEVVTPPATTEGETPEADSLAAAAKAKRDAANQGNGSLVLAGN